jgi:hypothetical protein
VEGNEPTNILSVVIRNKKNQWNEWESLLPVNSNRRKYRVFLIVCLAVSNFSCQCKSNANTRNQKPITIFFSPPLKCHQTHFLMFVSLLMADTVLLQQAPPFKTVLHFKELRLFAKNCSCRLWYYSRLASAVLPNFGSDIHKELL